MTDCETPENGEDCFFRFDNPIDYCSTCYQHYVEAKK